MTEEDLIEWLNSYNRRLEECGIDIKWDLFGSKPKGKYLVTDNCLNQCVGSIQTIFGYIQRYGSVMGYRDLPTDWTKLN